MCQACTFWLNIIQSILSTLMLLQMTCFKFHFPICCQFKEIWSNVLYPLTLVQLYIISTYFVAELLKNVYIYNHFVRNKHSCLFSFSIIMEFCSCLISLTRFTNTMLNRSWKCRFSFLFLTLREKSFSISPLNMV